MSRANPALSFSCPLCNDFNATSALLLDDHMSFCEYEQEVRHDMLSAMPKPLQPLVKVRSGTIAASPIAVQSRQRRLSRARPPRRRLPLSSQPPKVRAEQRMRRQRTAAWCDKLPSRTELALMKASPLYDELSPPTSAVTSPGRAIVKHLAKAIQRARFEEKHDSRVVVLIEPTETRRVTLGARRPLTTTSTPSSQARGNRKPRTVYLNSGLLLPRIYRSFSEALAIDVRVMPTTSTADLVSHDGRVIPVLAELACNSKGIPGMSPVCWPDTYNWGATIFNVTTTPRTFMGYLAFTEPLVRGQYTLRQSNGACHPVKIRHVPANDFI